MAIFLPKPWVNPFGKMSIFQLFELLVFKAQKVFFSLQNSVNDIFLAYIAYNKKVGKMAIFRLFELVFFISQKGVLSLQNIVKDIFLAYFAKKKSWKNGHIPTKTIRLTPLEKCEFFDFLNFLFYSLESRFFCSRIS